LAAPAGGLPPDCHSCTDESMSPILSIRDLRKSYASGHIALDGVDLDIREGEIFALLGPNGAGKTTLINIVCGIVQASGGTVRVAGFDHVAQYRQARCEIGLVPQELLTDAFETVLRCVRFSRGLFGKPRDDALIERMLRALSLWDKRNARMLELSGGMKRRVMIAKALVHEPRILFLDEPTAGVDVELRRDMWELVRALRDTGVTIILTTHYIEEAEEMADRVGVIDKGRLIVVEDKHRLMEHMGGKTLSIRLTRPLVAIPEALAEWHLALNGEGDELNYRFGRQDDARSVSGLLARLNALGIDYDDLSTRQSSLEDIFVGLIHERNGATEAQR